MRLLENHPKMMPPAEEHDNVAVRLSVSKTSHETQICVECIIDARSQDANTFATRLQLRSTQLSEHVMQTVGRLCKMLDDAFENHLPTSGITDAAQKIEAHPVEPTIKFFSTELKAKLPPEILSNGLRKLSEYFTNLQKSTIEPPTTKKNTRKGR